MGWALVVLLAAPLAASILCAVLPPTVSPAVTITVGALAFAVAVALVPGHSASALGGWLRVDALSVTFVLPTAFVYLTTAIFAAGYLHPPGDEGGRRRYGRRFHTGMNLFAWAMLAAPLMSGLALLWVAIEVTTVVSALLVALEDTPGATEAAWKYVLIASMGLGVALVATIFMYYAGATILGSGFQQSYPSLLAAAGHFPGQVTKLAFVLAVVGFGTKMGLVPMHTWLPDAHSEAPTPVSALLSAALLAVCFYAILRYYEIAERAVGPGFPRHVLLAFGLASLLLATFAVATQRDAKRLLAYSSVEHMGILSIGMSFSAPLAVVGVLLHVLAHAAAKGTAFFGVGSVLRKFGSKDLHAVRGGASLLPWSGPMLVLAVLALSALPPFGIFRSEFLIVAGGLSRPGDVVPAVLVVAVTVAAMGLTWYVGSTMLSPASGKRQGRTTERPAPADASPASLSDGRRSSSLTTVPVRRHTPLERGEVSAWIVVAMVLGLAALVMLGVHPPGALSDLLHRAAAQLDPRR